ncbi:hypothetical protein J2T12_004701 [Paenibacillus anaericanus]|uniref:Uncharacterized protein n=1 Tax=Paenibacillus anaericanus TaxID=170367 RepID=A0A433Y5P6_9BACL|nr:DUF5665 domain-containing protein [Paenibacillus anaericanus]MDQ0091264.1 hypothetical protein [Paenibacillus anaericanus]RUT43906.1 hypothetical protein EJP82_18345 [Paenibacillus anaericanus]
MEPLKSYDPKEHPFELRHEVKRLNSRLDSISHLLEKAEFKDIIENYADPKKRLFTNFMAGLSRGLGLSVGTFVVLGLLGWLLTLFVDLPMVGDYIKTLQDYIKSKP